MRVLGFMSGTSLDGVDAAIIDTDGGRLLGLGPARLLAFTPVERASLVAATETIVAGGDAPRLVASAEAIILDTHLRAARQLIADDRQPIDLVGFHGQTVLHRPELGWSRQLGRPDQLAAALGVPVIADFRQADLSAGGEGAPIVPIYHAALAEWLRLERPLAFLNIGGVANLTWLGANGDVVACDTGPGNGLIDLMVQARGLGRYDADGMLAARGHADRAIVEALLTADYFHRAGPKSLDRYDFGLDAVATLSAEDAAATLAALTVEGVALAAARLPQPPLQWLVCGGGRHNPALMRLLTARLGAVLSADAAGARGDFIEAEAIAYLAARSVLGLPYSYPSTTGVPHPMTGGTRYDPPAMAAA